MADRVLGVFYGVLTGLGVPGAWLLWRAFSTRRSWWISWIKGEMHNHYNVYLPLTICAVAFFGIIGYLIGRRKSELLEEAEGIKDANMELEQLAATDGLTGLFNARYMRERLSVELENAFRSPLACLVIDIDHFKKINDTYGHPFGDSVLIGFAKILQQSVRRMDVVGRLGGEEFIAVLPDTPAERAMMVAERIREAVQAEAFSADNQTIHITASIGVATHPTEGLRDGAALLKAADTALYSAKKSGRNRVSFWSA